MTIHEGLLALLRGIAKQKMRNCEKRWDFRGCQAGSDHPHRGVASCGGIKSGGSEAIRPLLDVISARSARSPCRDAPAVGGVIRSGGGSREQEQGEAKGGREVLLHGD